MGSSLKVGSFFETQCSLCCQIVNLKILVVVNELNSAHLHHSLRDIIVTCDLLELKTHLLDLV